jgi:DnaJ family protein C protein 2
LFDSIDVPESYDVIPKETKDADKFFETFGKAFKINQRWFKTAVPLLGDMTATEEEVEEIYATWYDADSWREFGYYDKENADNANSRDEKRYLEQKNKAERKRLNKEEKSRMIKLIDLTYKCDPRRIIFRAQRKDAKESAAKEKEDAKAAAIKEKADAAAAIEAAATAAADSAKDANEEGRKARAAFAKKAKKMKVTEVTPEQVGAMKGLLSVADMKSCTGLREKEELVKRLLELYEANKEAVDAAVAAL